MAQDLLGVKELGPSIGAIVEAPILEMTTDQPSCQLFERMKKIICWRGQTEDFFFPSCCSLVVTPEGKKKPP